MKLNIAFRRISILLSIPFFISLTSANAGDLEWNGLYRIEGYSFDNPGLTSNEKSKQYGIHHLILQPRIVAGDGLYIRGQFHILNSSNSDSFRGGPQMGAVWGSGLGDGVADDDASNTSSASKGQDEATFGVSEFYLTLAQEFGSLIVGRAPLEFGLGVSYSAGKGLFDHFYTNRDLVGYKVVMGNFFFTPMYAKIDENGLAGPDDISETIVHVQYENPESQVAMGVMYNNRRSGNVGNDFPIGSGVGSPFQGGTRGNMNLKTLNIFYQKSFENDQVGFEIVNLTGDYGITNTGGAGIEANAFAFALEYDHKPAGARTHWGVKAGWAGGDDPTTPNEYEGFAFDQNYDLGVMLFNHAMGQQNLLKTQLLGTRFNADRGAATGVNSTSADADIEAVSNAYFVAPKMTYKWRDRWDIEALLVGAWLDSADIGTGPTTSVDKALGYELDVSLVFKPNERVVWQNTLGLMSPGSAFEFNGAYDTKMAIGFVSRAAISF